MDIHNDKLLNTLILLKIKLYTCLFCIWDGTRAVCMCELAEAGILLLSCRSGKVLAQWSCIRPGKMSFYMLSISLTFC